jgi:hemerythrin
MSLEWREQLSVGNDLIDSDHKHLIEIINLAKHGLTNRSRTELTTALDSLSKYSKIHFSREELIADAVGYGEVSHLQASHAGLLENLEQLKAEIGEVWTEAAAVNFSSFLRNWLLNHVIKEDMLMKPFLKKFSPRFDPR